MDLSSGPAEDQETVKNLLNEVEKYYEIFQANMKNLKGRKVKRNAFSKINKQIIHSILIVFSDASGGKKYSLYGCVAYVRNTYEDNSIKWMLVAAMSKIADEDMTIVIKELKGVKLATILAHRVCKALNIEKTNTYYFCDNTIVIDQISSCREKGISGLTRGVGNLIAKIAHEIPDGHLLFVPSEYTFVHFCDSEQSVMILWPD